MNKELLKVSIRQNAILIPTGDHTAHKDELQSTTAILVKKAAKLGFGFSEELLRAINPWSIADKSEMLEVLNETTGTHKGWTPLIRAWDIPTGESVIDHLATNLANAFGDAKGTRLRCGHLIPDNTFPLSRYNGCPYCGTPFDSDDLELKNQGSKLKVLDLWTGDQLKAHFHDLLTSKVALVATQLDSLRLLINHQAIPDNVEIGMKETLVVVIKHFVSNNELEKSSALLKNPSEILRFLWYEHTGLLQIVQPKTILKRKTKNQWLNGYGLMKVDTDHFRNQLKLKYNRKMCRTVAFWMNNLPVSAETACEAMHPQRNMWVRFIRALKLSEYAKKQGYERLATLLDTFYNKLYDVWQAQVDYYRRRNDEENTFRLLKQRPGVMARGLFSNMLWFGPDVTLSHFNEIRDALPARLLYTLNMYAPYYFDKSGTRSVRPLGDINKMVPNNKFLGYYDDDQLKEMTLKVTGFTESVIKERFAKIPTGHTTIFIEETLYKMPLAIGDRSEAIQDMQMSNSGARFPVSSSQVRLFMQWGTGMKAQHLDMDLSCQVFYHDRTEYCSYMQLTIAGCQHSGDIQHIPDKVGTAEYIELNLDQLRRLGATHVAFTCNAYTSGSLTENMVVGWMDSKFKMTVSNRSGVAYDPSCVQQQIRIGKSLTKGMVFGVLDVLNAEIIWLEMSFNGAITQHMDQAGLKALLNKLSNKLTVGKVLDLKASAQGMISVDDPEAADEVYDTRWIYQPGAISSLMVE